MAVGHDFSSSIKIGNLTSLNLDLDIIRSLKGCGYLTYDGTRIKWSQDLQLLKNFVENIAGLRGNWSSPGGKAKQFRSSNLDFTLTWYPGKQNSLTLNGKDGEIFKEFLVNVLNTDRVDQTDITSDSLFISFAESCNTINNASTETDQPLQSETSVISCATDPINEQSHCKDCEHMEMKMLEIERKVDCLYDLTHKIYNSLNKPTIINVDSEQLYKSDVLNNDNQTENSSRSEYYDLSMDLEGVKLDVVINQSKLSNSISINQKDTSHNTEAINQLRDQLSNMQSRIVVLEAKLDNPLPKKLTNENSPENNESKTASPPTQPPLNQLNNVEISIIKPLALDENTNQSRVNLQSNQEQNEWLNPALDPLELNKTDKISHRNKCEIKEATNIQYNDQGEAIRDADCSPEQSVTRRIKPKPNTKYKGHKTSLKTINSLKQMANGTTDVTHCDTNNRIEHSDQDQSEKKYKHSLPSKQPHEWLKWLPLLELLEPNETDEVSYRNKSEIKEATNAQFNDPDETNWHVECSEPPNSIQSLSRTNTNNCLRPNLINFRQHRSNRRPPDWLKHLDLVNQITRTST